MVFKVGTMNDHDIASSDGKTDTESRPLSRILRLGKNVQIIRISEEFLGEYRQWNSRRQQ
jgi:hypothetical protein